MWGASSGLPDPESALLPDDLKSFLARAVADAQRAGRFVDEWRRLAGLVPLITSAWELGESFFHSDLAQARIDREYWKYFTQIDCGAAFARKTYERDKTMQAWFIHGYLRAWRSQFSPRAISPVEGTERIERPKERKGGNVNRSQQESFEEGRILTPEEVARIEARKQAAIRAAQGTPGTRTRHLRLSIDFHVTIAGTPPDDDGMNEPDPVYHARQARLLAAVKSSPAVQKQWMRDLIVSQMRQKGWSYWGTLTGGEVAFQDMLAPALEALSEEDQAYFAEGARDGHFEDYIDLFQASFTITKDVPVIHEQEGEA